MKRFVYSTAIACLLTGFSKPYEGAFMESACTFEIKRCFALSDTARDACFQNTSKGGSCLNSREAALAAKRASFTSAVSDSTDDTSSTPEAKIINRECVKNFDNLWLSNIVNGPLSEDTISNLNTMLDGCALTSPNDIMRP
jgi:hypothetical protein